MVTAANALNFDVIGTFKFSQNRLSSTFCDANGGCYIAYARIWIAIEMDQHMAVVREECPTFGIVLLDTHTLNIAEIQYLKKISAIFLRH